MTQFVSPRASARCPAYVNEIITKALPMVPPLPDDEQGFCEGIVALPV